MYIVCAAESGIVGRVLVIFALPDSAARTGELGSLKYMFIVKHVIYLST